jgi:hypothetical protein
MSLEALSRTMKSIDASADWRAFCHQPPIAKAHDAVSFLLPFTFYDTFYVTFYVPSIGHECATMPYLRNRCALFARYMRVVAGLDARCPLFPSGPCVASSVAFDSRVSLEDADARRPSLRRHPSYFWHSLALAHIVAAVSLSLCPFLRPTPPSLPLSNTGD